MGLSPEAKGSVLYRSSADAPSESVGGVYRDYAREWMVGVEEVELGEDDYRLSLQTPIGMLSPEVRVIEHGSGTIGGSTPRPSTAADG